MNERFFQGVHKNKVRISVGELELPIQYLDIEAMLSYFPVATPAIAGMLPKAGLQPVQIRPGVALLGITAAEYKKSSIGAYSEVAIVVPCLRQPRFNIPLLPLWFPRWFPSLAGYILKMPVSTEFACIAGKEIWGYPKFLADIDFEEQESHRICTLSHEGSLVLRYSVRKPTVPRYAQRSYATYSSMGQALLQSRVVTQGLLGVSKKAESAELQFGRHPLALQLSELKPGPARATYYYPKMQGLAGWASKSYDLSETTIRHTS
jgi:hypothetical protein